ncbi:30S ribosomal protein S3 [Metamycoplasma hyosynoviae]|uniref:Small ribosomal subunit protein uS3 n=1 Tax=Metamycoplasma hyosynoviae TaxID=29559 RepID=A0A063YCC3_9BACT|nr:30S ribosomal protein S3 [Metamycoplasma hyosynoviae]KDE41927.1 30S ribosomal protein S3 [Metamycoplasma hyosynoviae]KDE41974.1 30S ribosomal protein S3 [Metamycoplasma hyosynoviae]KDE43335.1 30S ribosomal protein S3 [Metamycoplasma hyosynoviae]KDE43812.1 30S ribosomal protein S3 [Metamycoplasma hyosynoviae]KDE45154.1 30S ribosomal protein S3 [Metamycoplasma hyosynoviae]
MGQKVNPNGFRYGITKEHNSKWYADKAQFASTLLEDQKIYDFFERKVRNYQIGKVQINRDQNKHITVTLFTAKPALVLGNAGENIKTMTLGLKKFIRNKKANINIVVLELKKPDLNARLLAESIAVKLENRGNFRLAQKMAIRAALKAGAKGIKTSVSGRLNGVDMARTEGYTEGEMKLHTLRQSVDYALAEAKTTYGILGVKVWVSLGEILNGKSELESLVVDKTERAKRFAKKGGEKNAATKKN